MAGSSFGTLFRVTTWGESHGKALGVTVDGCPAGLSLSEDDIAPYMKRRKPGQNRFTTPRNEADEIIILSGVFEGKTAGTPISLMVMNKDQHSFDYNETASVYRPGHADYAFDKKYGFRDYRGGGRSSGRETLARVAAGSIAAKLLKEFNIEVTAYTYSIGNIALSDSVISHRENITKETILNSPLFMPDGESTEKAVAFLSETTEKKDSAGGIVECFVTGLPAGLGEPVFDKLDAKLGQAMLSIGAVKGVEIGDGFKASLAYGSENNDSFFAENGHIKKSTNHSGGTLGGMSDGSTLLIRAAFKPTPSIGLPQHTVNNSGENIEISIKGRHDPVIVPRAVVVVEAMTAITLADLLLQNSSASLINLKKIYS